MAVRTHTYISRGRRVTVGISGGVFVPLAPPAPDPDAPDTGGAAAEAGAGTEGATAPDTAEKPAKAAKPRRARAKK